VREAYRFRMAGLRGEQDALFARLGVDCLDVPPGADCGRLLQGFFSDRIRRRAFR